MKQALGFLSLLVVVSMTTRAFSAGPPIDTAKLLDLTYTFDSSTIYWPTEHPFVHQFEHYGMTPEGYFYSSGKYAAPEHGGTHMDAPLHFNKKGITADQVPLNAMVGPAAVIDFSARTANDPDAMMSADDILKWESKHG